MLELPSTTFFHKRIPKQKFYDKLTVSPALKRCFVEQIKSIYWRNKIAVNTVNLSSGSLVEEIEVFEINLSTRSLDESVIRQIDSGIPYHILFLLEYQGKYQAWIGYKEATLYGSKAFKVISYFHTEWMLEKYLPIKIEGGNLDIVYENFVRQIAGDDLKSNHQSESLSDLIYKFEQRQKLQKEIARLEKQARAEKQPKKKFELAQQVNKLKNELEALH